MVQKIKVLYIAGWGRSGTTILDNIFGQLNDSFSVGELRYIWERNIIENRPCGCGRAFSQCTIWQEIMREAFGDIEDFDPKLLKNLTHRYTRTLRIFGLFFLKGRKIESDEFEHYLEALERLYKSISRVTNSKIIVDSSKHPTYLSMLRLIQSLDVYIVHIVRDPRAVAYSWMTPKKPRNVNIPNDLITINPLMSSLLWNIWNLAIEYLARFDPSRYLQISYEDFATSPLVQVKKILSFLGEEQEGLPFLDSSKITLKRTHTTSGNPSRFQNGIVDVRLDSRWHSNLKPFHKSMVTLIAFPLLTHYGYKVNP